MLQPLEVEDLLFLVPDEDGVAFTARPGGFSDGAYRGLNLSYSTGDERDRVAQNRSKVSRALGIPEQWACARQVHGSRTVEASPENLREVGRQDADAIVTHASRVPVAVLVADCLPVALVGNQGRSVVHAGWRGLCAGVIESAVQALREAAPRAWIGPSVGPCHYQVGTVVIEQFRSAYPESPPFWERRATGTYFDLPAAGTWVLRRAGVKVEEHEPVCTVCDPRFFSYRRDGVTGRQAVLVWR